MDSNLQYSDLESMGRVATPGGDLLDDLLDDLLTSCAGILRSIAFTIMKVTTNSASWLYYISLVLGKNRQECSLKTIPCEARPFRGM